MQLIVKPDLAGRRAAALANPSEIPSTAARAEQDFGVQLRSTAIERDGKSFYQLDGIASVVERWYQMYDFFGPYEEMVAEGAFDNTLREDPDVNFLLNHRGLTMARTRGSKTLELSVAENGDLAMRAFLNPERQDVRDLVTAVDDGDIDQMSFAFRIKRGEWNPDYTTYTILEVDLHRGDVSAVNYGANPFTSIAARAHQVFDGIDHLEGVNLRAAAARIQQRLAEQDPAETDASTAGPTGQTGADIAALVDANLI